MKTTATCLLVLLLLIGLTATAQQPCNSGPPAKAVIDWPEFRFDLCHTGYNPYEFADGDGYNPGYLVQDSAGNLYGIVSVYNMVGMFPLGVLFTLQTTNPGWIFSENVVRHSCQPNDLPFEYLNNLAIDAAGNLYGTGTGGETYFDSSGRNGPPYFGECVYNYIFKASYAEGSWQDQDLDFLSNIYFSSSGSLAMDTSGNLYGATYDCGTNGHGTVWKFSP